MLGGMSVVAGWSLVLVRLVRQIVDDTVGIHASP